MLFDGATAWFSPSAASFGHIWCNNGGTLSSTAPSWFFCSGHSDATLKSFKNRPVVVFDADWVVQSDSAGRALPLSPFVLAKFPSYHAHSESRLNRSVTGYQVFPETSSKEIPVQLRSPPDTPPHSPSLDPNETNSISSLSQEDPRKDDWGSLEAELDSLEEQSVEEMCSFDIEQDEDEPILHINSIEASFSWSTFSVTNNQDSPYPVLSIAKILQSATLRSYTTSKPVLFVPHSSYQGKVFNARKVGSL